MDRVRGQADLILVRGIFYLCVVVETDEASSYDPVGVLGVDLGIKNLAVDSDGEVHSGEKISQTRDRLDSLKARLQSKGTKSAKRHLKKLSGRMSHCRAYPDEKGIETKEREQDEKNDKNK